MSKKLLMLYNTLLTVETKGNNTLTMADCLRYLERMIQESQEKETVETEE